jgi:hypothetical protein
LFVAGSIAVPVGWLTAMPLVSSSVPPPLPSMFAESIVPSALLPQ